MKTHKVLFLLFLTLATRVLAADPDSIANWVRTERTQRKVTQVQLSKDIGVTPSYITKIEKGDSLPSMDILAAFFKIFGTSAPEQQMIWDLLSAERLARTEERLRRRFRTAAQGVQSRRETLSQEPHSEPGTEESARFSWKELNDLQQQAEKAELSTDVLLRLIDTAASDQLPRENRALASQILSQRVGQMLERELIGSPNETLNTCAALLVRILAASHSGK